MTNILLQIPCWIQWWKNFKNRPTFGKIINERCHWSSFDSHCNYSCLQYVSFISLSNYSLCEFVYSPRVSCVVCTSSLYQLCDVLFVVVNLCKGRDICGWFHNWRVTYLLLLVLTLYIAVAKLLVFLFVSIRLWPHAACALTVEIIDHRGIHRTCLFIYSMLVVFTFRREHGSVILFHCSVFRWLKAIVITHVIDMHLCHFFR